MLDRKVGSQEIQNKLSKWQQSVGQGEQTVQNSIRGLWHGIDDSSTALTTVWTLAKYIALEKSTYRYNFFFQSLANVHYLRSRQGQDKSVVNSSWMWGLLEKNSDGETLCRTVKTVTSGWDAQLQKPRRNSCIFISANGNIFINFL